MLELPEGVVTFVFTDVEGSTRLWEDAPDSMMAALMQHDDIIERAIAEHGGISVKPRGEGDSRFLVFEDAGGAVAAIADIQRTLAAADWPTPRPIRIRAALHTGMADLQLGDYYGSSVNRAARLRGIAHGGQTVMSAATWELVRDRLPNRVTIRDMGEHGLKDLSRREHVYQIDIEGVSTDFPRLASIDAIPNNLPVQLTEFVGREQEIVEAKRLLESTRLLTIMAPGGAGKTRLGIQVAADVVADHPDGVYFVALGDISSSGEIVQSIAEALGLGLSADEEPRNQLLTYLSSKRQLLVFDNFEHVADGAAIISEILRAAGLVKVIATSRARLNLTGETLLTLGGLEIEWETPEEAMRTSGVQLFVAAARRANPSFVLAPDAFDDLSKILRLTGGMPLGILLAAAWVDMLPVAQIAEEVGRSLDFLETQMGDVPARHRSIRAVFDYTWRLLGDGEQKTFTALSVFRGGFTRSGAEAVAGASLRALATLSSKSLVAPSPESGRYEVHELLRQYALGELEKDPDRHRAVLDAHAAFHADLLDEAWAAFVASDQPGMLAAIEPDIDNIRSGWRHYLATGDAAGAVRYMPLLYFLYEIRGWYQAGVALFGEALEACASSDSEGAALLRAMAQSAQGWALALLGRAHEGVAATTEAIDTMPENAGLVYRWIALQCRALALAYVGELDEMARMLDQGIEECAAEPDPFWARGLDNWRSFAAIAAGDLDTARKLLPEAMELFEGRHEHYFMVWNLWLQAMIATAERRPRDAVELSARQLARARAIGYLRGKVVALENLGDANVADGRFDDAAVAFVDGIEVADQMGMVPEMLGMLTKVGSAWAALGRDVEAVELLASVYAEPMSARQPFTATVPIRESARSILAGLRERLPADVYSAANSRGSAWPYDVAANELIGARAGHSGAWSGRERAVGF